MNIDKVKQLTSNMIWNILSMLLNILVVFFLTPIIITALGEKIYGLWILIGSFMGYYGFLDLGLSSAVRRYLTRAIGKDDTSELSQIASTSFFLFSIIGVVVFLVSVLLAYIFPSLAKVTTNVNIFRLIIMIMGFNIALSFPSRSIGAIMSSYLRTDLYNFYVMLTTVIRTLLIYIAIRLDIQPLKLLLVIAVLTLLCSMIEMFLTAVTTFKLYDHIKIKLSCVRRSLIKKMFSYSSITFISMLADTLRFQIDNLVITMLLGVTSVTPYSIGFRLVQYFQNLVFSIVSVMNPIYSIYEGANDYAALREKYLFAVKVSTVLSFYLGLSMIIFGKAFIIRWVGKELEHSYYVMFILVIGFIVSLTQSQGIQLMYGVSRHKFVAFMNIFEGVMNLVLSLLLAPKYGIYGVALGTTLPLLFTKLFMQPAYVCKIIKLPLHIFITVLLRISICTIIPFVLYYLLIRAFILPTYFRLVLLALPIPYFYFPVIYYLVFNSTEKSYIWRALQFFNKE